MAFDAILNTDKSLGSPPKRRQTTKGWTGQRSYRVMCIDEDLAWGAIGLPKIGQSWSAAAPNLKVVDIDPAPHSGKLVDPVTGGGLTIFEVRYETPGLSGKIPYQDGLKFTVLDPSVTEITAYKRADYDPAPDKPIDNGRGAQLKVPTLGAKVYAYYNPEKWNGLVELLGKRGRINKDTVELPPCLGAVNGFVMKPMQVLYLAPQISQVSNLIEVVHNLELASDFKFRFANEGPDGEVAPVADNDPNRDPDFANVLMVDIYPRADLGGLW